MTLLIDVMTINDYDEVYELWEQTEVEGVSEADGRVPIGRFLERNPDLCFVARVDGHMVGVLLVGYDGRRGYLHHLAVHPDYRRKGIGKRMVERCLGTLREMGVQKCHLFVTRTNKGAIAFWKRMGWRTRTELTIMSREI